MRAIEQFAFFLLLVTLPLQLGKHFWPEFSLVQGIRVDYLSPTIHISDVSFLLLFAVSVFRLRRKIVSLLLSRVVIFTFLILILSTLFASQPLAALYGVTKFLQFFYIGFYVAMSFGKLQKPRMLFALVLGGLIEVIIALLQFFSQRSIGGVFYYLGERTFDAATPGIALFRLGEQLLLRPYATFPHPNVLAFYLLGVFTILLFSVNLVKRRESLIRITALTLLSLGIFITVSRVVMVLYFIVVIVWFIGARGMRKSMRARISIAVTLFLCSMIAIMFGRFGSTLIRDALLRVELLEIGLKVFLQNPLFGVGLNNFFYHEIYFQKEITPILLQPIHNIFFLWVVQTGMLGGVVMGAFLYKVYRRIKTPQQVLFALFVIAVGMFDHYLLTLQQGQLMLSLIAGFLFVRVKDLG